MYIMYGMTMHRKKMIKIGNNCFSLYFQPLFSLFSWPKRTMALGSLVVQI